MNCRDIIESKIALSSVILHTFSYAHFLTEVAHINSYLKKFATSHGLPLQCSYSAP